MNTTIHMCTRTDADKTYRRSRVGYCGRREDQDNFVDIVDENSPTEAWALYLRNRNVVCDACQRLLAEELGPLNLLSLVDL